MGVLPTKGLTLPLLSYGRSSLLVSLAWLGVLLRIYHEVKCTLALRRDAHARRRAMTRRPGSRRSGADHGGRHRAATCSPRSRWRRCCASEACRVVWLGVPGEHGVAPGAGERLPDRVGADRGIRGKGLRAWLLAPLRVATRALLQAAAHSAPRSAARGARRRRLRERSRRHRRVAAAHPAADPRAERHRRLDQPLAVALRRARCSRPFPAASARACTRAPSAIPVRADIAAIAEPAARFAGRGTRARLLVFGGSQGAQRLNAVVPQALSRLDPARRPQVRHQAGERGIEAARAAYRALEVEAEVLPFIEDMAAAYAWADLALCRAGAMTIAELQAAGLGALLVPLPRPPPTITRPRTPRRWCAIGRGARAAGARADARSARAPASPSSRRTARDCSRWRGAARVGAQRRRGGAPRGSVHGGGERRGMNDRMRRIHLIHLVGIGGSGMGGIAEVLLNLGYEVQGSDLKANAVTAAARRASARRSSSATPPSNLRQGGRGGGLERRRPRQSGGCGRAREPHPGGAARGDAGRADALPLLDRGRGHPRQDHHHESGRERARARAGSIRPSSSAGA